MNIGEKIKKHRIEAGLTQAELGAKCRPVQAFETISRYENNRSKPNFNNLVSLMFVLNISISDLMEADDK